MILLLEFGIGMDTKRIETAYRSALDGQIQTLRPEPDEDDSTVRSESDIDRNHGARLPIIGNA